MKKLLLLISVFIIGLMGCVKDDFDNPQQYSDPNLPVNFTIKELKQLLINSGDQIYSIDKDLIIAGIITADDKTQNFYKEIVIQDSSAAIGIKIDQNSIYNDYPIGRKVYVKLKGLALGNFKNLISLGGYVDSVSTSGVKSLGMIVSNKISAHLIKGPKNNVLPITEVTISQLNDDYQYKLVRIKNVEFDCIDLNNTYADALNQNDASRYLNDNNSSKIILRSSGYATFAGTRLAGLNGEATAIYTVYNTDKQLKIRDVSDLNFKNNRNEACVAGPPITIKELRNMFSGNAVTLGAIAIQGTVISDKSTNNINGQNIIIQDSTAGIMVRFSGTHNFKLHDKVLINLKNGSLEDFKGLLQVNGASLSGATYQGNAPITPRTATITEINANFENWESTLVKIKGVQLSGTPAQYSGNKTVLDAGGKTITMYTMSSATFAGANYKTGMVDVTGYLGQFNTTNQIQIRGEADVEGGTSGGGGGNETKLNIMDLRNQFTGTAVTIGSYFIEGTVISDKSTANLNSQNLVIQDATGGILVRFSAAHSFNLGDVVKIIVTGNSLDEFRKTLQVNNTALANATKTGNGSITPVVLTMAQIRANFDNYESTLVKIKGINMPSGTYSGSKTISDNTSSLTLFTLFTASFSSSAMPGASADVTGYLANFDTTAQLQIRNPVTDVSSSGGGGGGGTPTTKTIMDIRNMHAGVNKIFGASYEVTGTVISDKDSGQWTSLNIVVQDNSGGITIRFASGTPTFAKGDIVKITLGATDSLTTFNGGMQIKTALSNITKTGSGSITPRVATITDINTNFANWESTLVTIQGGTFAPGTFSGSKDFTVGTDKIVHFTRPGATGALFAGANVPSGTVNITGVLSYFNTTKQISIRNRTDIQ
jgi:DNA/RNA endonuclease YhcR with UshA esterase domain